MKIDFGKCLILSPHYDDWFFGCYGFIKRGEGTILIFSTGAAVSDADEEARKVEMIKAREIIPKQWHVVESGFFAARQFFRVMDQIRDHIWTQIHDHKPQTLLIPGGRHEDHDEVRMEAERVAEDFDVNLIYYYVKLNSLVPKPNACLNLTFEESNEKSRFARDLWVSQSKRLYKLQHGGTELYRWEDGSW